MAVDPVRQRAERTVMAMWEASRGSSPDAEYLTAIIEAALRAERTAALREIIGFAMGLVDLQVSAIEAAEQEGKK